MQLSAIDREQTQSVRGELIVPKEVKLILPLTKLLRNDLHREPILEPQRTSGTNSGPQFALITDTDRATYTNPDLKTISTPTPKQLASNPSINEDDSQHSHDRQGSAHFTNVTQANTLNTDEPQPRKYTNGLEDSRTQVAKNQRPSENPVSPKLNEGHLTAQQYSG